jgi:hypothetical protein
MSAWEMLKKTTPMHLCLSKDATYIDKDGLYISKSGIDNYLFNMAIVENNDPEKQKDIMLKHFNCNGLIISREDAKESIDSWAFNNSIEYIGKYPLLIKEQKDTNVEYKKYDNITVKRVNDADTFEKFFNIFTHAKDLTQEESIKLFSKKVFDLNYFLYVAYYNNIPAGIVVMINVGDSIMITGMDVLEEFRQLNVLNALSEKCLSDAIQNNIYNYSALATSPFSYRVAVSHGYEINEYCHIWKKINKHKDGEV